MVHRALIERTEGMLMAIHQIDAGAAFDMLVKLSQIRNRTLWDAAIEVVADYAGSADGDRAHRQLR
jgi:AmiR/NasT family two-component response regulator